MFDLEQDLRTRFPAPAYRVSRYEYPAGTIFPGATKSATCYVLRGECKYIFGPNTFQVSAGQHYQLPDGRYLFEVLGNEGVVLFLVWNVHALTAHL
jgi:quercetin dioxygenase-like cupin family protein